MFFKTSINIKNVITYVWAKTIGYIRNFCNPPYNTSEQSISPALKFSATQPPQYVRFIGTEKVAVRNSTKASNNVEYQFLSGAHSTSQPKPNEVPSHSSVPASTLVEYQLYEFLSATHSMSKAHKQHPLLLCSLLFYGQKNYSVVHCFWTSNCN